ncbi:hypothetical protein MWN33_10915 [Starkeya koreensis]|uniref:Uncharacterized protein n=1 Tax=Ancylobacter koreensis TaxID=266121 RepID=A0ABT0DMN5_9HYPH|nr:hypothetical protein [Ancylobacter koreensis]MCK0208542.1 hypothetical protein [Ancylobacter koreensis]
MMNTTGSRELRRQPIHVRIGQEDIEIASLDGAIDLIRSLRHDRLGHFAEMLLAQMESARLPEQREKAWVAFETWADACQLRNDERHWSHAA